MKTAGTMKKSLSLMAMVLSLVIVLSACGSGTGGNDKEGGNAGGASGASAAEDNPTLEELVPLAQKEGKLSSVGMPDSWANWKGTWEDLKSKYNIEHTDTDMSSAEELAKFENEKKNPPDIGDVGIAFGPFAETKGLTLKYKTPYWDEIPAWGKDDDGDWMVPYTGTISFLCNKTLVDKCPASWEDINNGSYKVFVGDVTKAAGPQMAVLAAAMAFGGDETNIQPGLDYFARLADQGRISKVDASIPNLQKGEVAVAIMWDFLSVGNKEQIGADKFEAHIPSEGSVISGYASVINKNAASPNAAKLARAYIFSDEGQINLAKGFARPIRSSVTLPAEVESKLIPSSEYANAKPVNDYKAWEKTTKELPNLWLEQVQSKVK
ncbi:ABC transporter substrate-binding protein [Paenibacillus beijingensis]|uniref:ABC transporter substrate-binding protein n=1 Tax=Paenibacillus beijingensis TaxID=1126833 RepID=A0A0D5NIG1_9BACL|nr:ABC transporter substrate-binding protein [Paenibacillus beijingensis]AJY74762.1 ABC transporter substrate-binding protein [Paenibacillus beijingensis]